MFDGLYQSVVVFFIPYLLFQPARPVTENGLDISDSTLPTPSSSPSTDTS